MNQYSYKLIIVFSLLLMFVLPANGSESLSFNKAMFLAKKNDLWLESNKYQQQAVEANSIAASTLPDPRLSLSLQNMPVDSFSFSQEAMTQAKLGISQTIPRGESLSIKRDQLLLEAKKFPLMRKNREAKVQAAVAQLWLNAYLAQSTITLINDDKALFEQLVDIAKANYSSAVGKTRQQDVIRAQLELLQLEDRLTAQYQQLESSLALLGQWLYPVKSNNALASSYATTHTVKLSNEPPPISLINPDYVNAKYVKNNELANTLMQHPAIATIEQGYQASNKGVELSKQQYQPQWGVNASYGYRANAPSGEQRSDFFSVGLSVDLPLFTENKQDKKVAASIAQTESIKTNKLLTLRQMMSVLTSEKKQYVRTQQRQQLYQQQLVEQVHEQYQASLTAYTHDDGSFSDVIRSRITELNTRITANTIDVELLKNIVRINYYFTHLQAQGK